MVNEKKEINEILMTHNLWLNLGFIHNGGDIGSSSTTSRYYMNIDFHLTEDIYYEINKLNSYLEYKSGYLNYIEFINHDIKLSTVIKALGLINYHGGFYNGQMDIKTKFKELIK